MPDGAHEEYEEYVELGLRQATIQAVHQRIHKSGLYISAVRDVFVFWQEGNGAFFEGYNRTMMHFYRDPKLALTGREVPERDMRWTFSSGPLSQTVRERVENLVFLYAWVDDRMEELVYQVAHSHDLWSRYELHEWIWQIRRYIDGDELRRKRQEMGGEYDELEDYMDPYFTELLPTRKWSPFCSLALG
ncbi:hypothetical protein DL768_009288 [Monosporascus sp. mg162]|nr:hypothetical protein DL768_009288 [Monosporascus sp. mg162]